MFYPWYFFKLKHVKTFEIKTFNVKTFGIKTLNVKTFYVKSHDVQTFDVKSVGVKKFDVKNVDVKPFDVIISSSSLLDRHLSNVFWMKMRSKLFVISQTADNNKKH